MTNEDLLKIQDSPSEKYERVSYTYTADAHCNVPVEILDTEDEELIAEWIAKWVHDVPDIGCLSY